MFIRNASKVNFSNVYVCDETIGNFLIKSGIPLLAKDGKKMKFAKNEKLDEVLNNLPTHLKILRKVGIING